MKQPKYKEDKTLVYFVRHGERQFISDSSDDGSEKPGPGLNKNGKRQARAIAKRFMKIKGIDLLVSSSMRRAYETSKEIEKILNVDSKICDKICEFNKIVWKAKYYHINFWEHYLKYKDSLKFFDRLLKENKGKKIILVTHGNVIKGIIGKKLGLSLKQIKCLRLNSCHVTLAQFNGTKLEYLPYLNSPLLFEEY